MKNELNDEINHLKKEMVVAFTKYSLSGGVENNKDAVLNSILLSWFEEVNSTSDFCRKYEAFQKMSTILRDSLLFDLVETVFPLEQEDVRSAIHAYHDLLDNPEYQELSDVCGYKVPREFGNYTHYYDGVLRERVSFFRSFVERLDSIYKGLIAKGVVRK